MPADSWMLISERLVLTVWVGSIWAIGYIAAPVLFATLDSPELAGAVAGEMFSATAWLGLGCGVLLIAIHLIRERHAVVRSWRFLMVAGMLVLTLTGEFVLRAWMDAARGTEAFGPLHGLAQGVFLIVALLGLVLVAAGPQPARAGCRSPHSTAEQYAASSRRGSDGR